MDKVIGGVLGFVIAAGIVLGILALIWLVWCWVLPQVWPAGPSQLIAPGYWLFAAAWILFGFIGRQLFGSRSAK